MNGKRSAIESSPGGLLGLLVGLGITYLGRRYGIILPDGSEDLISSAIVGVAAGLGGILSSYHLGNRRASEQPHQGPGTSDSLDEANQRSPSWPQL